MIPDWESENCMFGTGEGGDMTPPPTLMFPNFQVTPFLILKQNSPLVNFYTG